MTDDRPSSTATEGRQTRSWLERLGQVLQGGEPQDREDLLEILRDAHHRGVIDRETLAMVEGVLSVNAMQVRDIMVPRPQMVVVERDASLEQFFPIITETGHSRYPVIGESRDEVVGILLAKDLLPFVAQRSGTFNIRDILRLPLFVPESKRLDALLKEFRSSRNHMAVVVDEYGGVAGLVTIEDVLEQIVGDIEDEHDVDQDEGHIQQTVGDRYLVQALTPIEEFNEHFETDLPDEEFDTIGGLVLNGFGYLPKRGESLDLDGYRFTVLRADNRRIHLLEMAPVGAPAEGGERPSGDDVVSA